MNKVCFEHIPCGPFANESEKNALDRLRTKLQGANKGGCWIFLTNIPLSFQSSGYSDEIDILVISSVGVTVIEVKHWDASFLRDRSHIVEAEAEKLNAKVRRVAGKLKNTFNVGFIEGRFLLTKTDNKLYNEAAPRKYRGVACYSLGDWKEILDIEKSHSFDAQIVKAVCKVLEPKTRITLSGDIRTFAGLTNLEHISSKDDRFHRVYKGIHLSRRDRVVLHLYDLSAVTDKNAENNARREYDSIQRLQKSPYLPRILDSFQFASEYPGELCFYSLVDPMIPSLSDKAKETMWPLEDRLIAAANCMRALDSLHSPVDQLDSSIIHRNLTSRNIRIRSNNSPLFTEWHCSKLPGMATIAPTTVALTASDVSIPPEIRENGISVADARSDVYALCYALYELFQDKSSISQQSLELLDKGLLDRPEIRISLQTLAEGFDALSVQFKGLNEKISDTAPVYQSWEEDKVVIFQSSSYRIINRLGSGGIGQTFKVVHIDKDGTREYGQYVAKIISDHDEADYALNAYRKARPYSSSPYLAVIYEIAHGWSHDTFSALMRWIPGIPLSDLTGVIMLHAEELGETHYESLVLGWLSNLSTALSSLHCANLVHGDVTPKNIIISGGDVTLIDYDAVIEAGSTPRIDTAFYSSPEVKRTNVISASDDLYALATTFFHVLFDKEPYRFGTEFDKGRGLNWDGVNEDELPSVVQFLKKATHPDCQQRFNNGAEAEKYIDALINPESVYQQPATVTQPKQMTPNTVPRLLDILLSYPGSLKGNRETRGLDTDFAIETYVETPLDLILYDEILARKVSLVILFGNAGDGKTAFLQHLAMKLKLPRQSSAERLWNHTLPNGLKIRANLDGSAAYQGRSATELLDEFFEPFHDCNPPDNLVHLIAINSGPLLKWLEECDVESRLTEQLIAVMEGDISQLDQRFRLLDLNNRSLVGGIQKKDGSISTDFIDSLLARFLGNDPNAWNACTTCTASARCSAWESVKMLSDPDKGPIVRHRFDEALQTVYQRGEIHITARELRAATSYIFFGLHYCEDLHQNPEIISGHYYNRAFDPLSPCRQGDLLRELVYLDPALEAHPKIDRYLLGHGESIGSDALQYPNHDLEPVRRLPVARRRAYFEWIPEVVSCISGDNTFFGLARGQHLERFRCVPLMDESERNILKLELCEGIAHLEELPSLAFDNHGIPLKIIPRTPTESALWVKKTFSRFSLQAVLPQAHNGLESLHTHLELIYHNKDGSEERLLMGTELFHILLELKAGMQLSDAASEDIFANLAIFTQRLAQEDSRELFAWNPIKDDKVFRVAIKMIDGKQIIECEPIKRESEI